MSLGYTDTGKRRRYFIYAKTKGEVQEKLRRIQNDASSGRLPDAGNLTVKDYLARWLENTARPSIAAKTHLRYEQLIRLRINPHIGSVRLNKLAPIHVEQLFVILERNGVSARGRQMTGTMLHTALRRAVQLKLIPYNPASDVAKPKPAKPEMQVYDLDQVARFLDAARTDRLFALYVLALDSGMRQGELFALHWTDFDFASGSVLVQRSLEEINGHHRLKETKSAKGRRRIPLSRFTLDALNEHRKRMLADGYMSGPVFCNTDGGFLHKANVLRRSFWPIITNANKEAKKQNTEPALLPEIRFHDLRHTCATLLLLAGENPKVVSERLGHASIELTLNCYSHVLPTMQQGAAAKMNAILGLGRTQKIGSN
jgi:integrase